MPKPNQAARDAHAKVRDFTLIQGPSERSWAHVLQDENWWGPDPEECCVCGGATLNKLDGKGYCKAHHSQAVKASMQSGRELLGRYDRAKQSLNSGRSRVSDFLPKELLRKAVGLEAHA